MTRVLFTCGRLRIGGVQRSLVSLLGSLDPSEIDATLIVDDLGGELADQVPADVRVLELDGVARQIHELGLSRSACTELLVSHPFIVGWGILRMLNHVTSAYRRKLLIQQVWRLHRARSRCTEIGPVADVAISYAGGMGVWDYYVIDEIRAPKKVVWLHGDYSRFGTGSAMERDYLGAFDVIVAVSDRSAAIIREELPEVADRVCVIPNLIETARIHQLANVEPIDMPTDGRFTFVTVARLDRGKGLDLGIEASARLVREGVRFRWLIIGDGSDREHLADLVNAKALGDHVVLMGPRTNPYSFMARADAILHPSRGEGRSIAVDEAKALHKPIVVTAYPTVGDQIEDGSTGVIVPVSAEGLYEGMKTIMSDELLRNRLKSNLLRSQEPQDTLERFMELIR